MNDYGLKAIESDELLVLRGVDVVARLTGLLAETTLTQKYRNDTKANPGTGLHLSSAGLGNPEVLN